MSAHNFWNNFTNGFMHGMFNNSPFFGGCMSNFNFFQPFNSCFTAMFTPTFNLPFTPFTPENSIYMCPNVMSQSNFYPYVQNTLQPPSIWNMTIDVNEMFPNEKWQTNTIDNYNYNFNKNNNNNSNYYKNTLQEDVFVRQNETKVNSTKKLNTKDCSTYNSIIQKYASKYDVDPNLIKAIIKQESSFNPKAVSPAGAKGLMQLMPGTASDMNVKDVFNPEQNIEGGVKYISRMLKRYNGNTRLALAAYNAGPGNVKNGKIPQNGQTPKYVNAVMKYYKEYQQA